MKVGAAASRSRPASTSASHAGCCAPGADVDQRADEVAHHVVQEGAGAQREHDHVAVPLDRHCVHLLDRRLGLAAGGAESRKIVGAEQVRRRFAHQLHVQRAEHPAGAPGQQRRTDAGCCTARSGRCASAPKSGRGSPGRRHRAPLRWPSAPRSTRAGRRSRRAPTTAVARLSSVSKWTTCSTACTPASVRPAQVVAAACRRISRARSRAGPGPCRGLAASGSRSRRCPRTGHRATTAVVVFTPAWRASRWPC